LAAGARDAVRFMAGAEFMDKMFSEKRAGSGVAGDAPGIVIHDRWQPMPKPAVTAFIWGGKVRPVPQLPYGRLSA